MLSHHLIAQSRRVLRVVTSVGPLSASKYRFMTSSGNANSGMCADLGGQLTSMAPSTLPVPNVRQYYYKVPHSDLGRGAFGRVFEVRDVSNGNRYAAKEYLGRFDL